MPRWPGRARWSRGGAVQPAMAGSTRETPRRLAGRHATHELRYLIHDARNGKPEFLVGRANSQWIEPSGVGESLLPGAPTGDSRLFESSSAALRCVSSEMA